MAAPIAPDTTTIAPQKLLYRHLRRFDAFLRDQAPDLEADDEVVWIMRRIARRADELRSVLAVTDREVWLAAQRELLGFGC
jgi:hypothetical protein